MSPLEFTAEIFQNEFLPDGARDVNAIVTVTSTGSAVRGPATGADTAAEIIIVDCSGSMGSPGSKIVQARQATAAAIDALRDGAAFAVIAGESGATPVYPADGSLAVASSQTREGARNSLTRLRPGGGTAIGEWLKLARVMFQAGDHRLRHAILLTDGQNGQRRGQLEAELDRCEGVFNCDCRGVGTDWAVAELRKISTALMGTVDIVPDEAGLAQDFLAMMKASMGHQLADVALRVWTPEHATIRYVKQVAPAVEDLTSRRVPVTPQAGDYPTGAWGAESRDYHICVEVQPASVGQEMLAARVSLVISTDAGPQTLGQGLVRAIWTDEEELSTRINGHVAHYTGQAELAQVIQDGLEARRAGDDAIAAAKLGRAVTIASESGNQGTADLLAKVVDVDPVTGTVRLKSRVVEADEMALDTRSTKTVRVRRNPEATDGAMP